MVYTFFLPSTTAWLFVHSKQDGPGKTKKNIEKFLLAPLPTAHWISENSHSETLNIFKNLIMRNIRYIC